MTSVNPADGDSLAKSAENSSECAASDAAGRTRFRGYGLLVTAALLWSTGGVFGKAPIFHDWPVESRGLLLAFWRALFAGLCLIPAVRRPVWSPRLIPMTICFAAMNVSYLTAMGLTSAANTIWLQSTAPFWVGLIGVVALRERLTRADLGQLVWIGLGIAIILSQETRESFGWGALIALSSGLLYGGVVIFLRGFRDLDAAWLIVVNHLVTAALLFPFVAARGEIPGPIQMGTLVAFGAIQMGLPYAIFARGLRTVPALEAAGIVLLEPVVLPYLVYLAWGEVPAWWTIAGGACILIGLAQRYLAAYLRARFTRVETIRDS